MMCMESQVCIIDSELTHSITIVCIIILIGFTTNIITSNQSYVHTLRIILQSLLILHCKKKTDNFI